MSMLERNWNYYDGEYVDATYLNGKVVKEIENDLEEMWFKLEDDSEVLMYHSQDCCEDVQIEDICGDLDDLIGYPLKVVESISNEREGVECYESCTWTFYRLSTQKGTVVIRWFGESNGYYSESVDFRKFDAKGEDDGKTK